MSSSIVIKGNPYGVSVIIDDKAPMAELKKELAVKFKEASGFFRDAKMAISFEGKKLTDEQQREFLDIIAANSDVRIVCIMEHDEEKEERFKQTLEETLLEMNQATGQFYKGNLRSGQVLETETSVIVVGDVNPGAHVVSKGNVIVLGSLKGTVFAGAAGNTSAFIVALDMDPIQIRIADIIAKAPETKEVRFRRREKETAVKEPKIAFLENGNVCVEQVSKTVLNEIKL